MNFLVYTVVTFGYDKVSPIMKKIRSNNIDFLLITDIEPIIAPEGWEVVVIDRDKNEDCFTYNRRLKFGFNPIFSKYKAVIYIDGSIKVKKNLDSVLNWCEITNFDFSASKHYLEHTIFDEIKHLNKLHKAKGDEIAFLNDFGDVKKLEEYIVFENGIFIRKINFNNIDLHQNFSKLVLDVLYKYNSRDQIIIPVIIDKLDLVITPFPYGFRTLGSPFSLSLHVDEINNLNVLQKIKFWLSKKN